jgi:muramoyltetrapeptide carboxypeptidase LdcA involved in peptidoglycan recycling
MFELGRGGAMHPYTQEALHRALFEQGTFEIQSAPEYTDEWQDFREPANLSRHPTLFPNNGWTWLNAEKIVEGTLWGGNLEIISWNLRANNYIQSVEAYAGKIFYFETSEELPSATEVYRILMGMGERGLLQQFAAVLAGRPKAWSFALAQTAEEKAIFTSKQVEAVTRALNEYHPEVPVVFNLDIGHTDPQCIFPNGGQIRIDGVQQKIYLTY